MKLVSLECWKAESQFRQDAFSEPWHKGLHSAHLGLRAKPASRSITNENIQRPATPPVRGLTHQIVFVLGSRHVQMYAFIYMHIFGKVAACPCQGLTRAAAKEA